MKFPPMASAKSLGYKVWSFHSKSPISKPVLSLVNVVDGVEALACSALLDPSSLLFLFFLPFCLSGVMNRLSWLNFPPQEGFLCISSRGRRVVHRCLYLIPQVRRNRTPYDGQYDTRGRQDSSCAEDTHQSTSFMIPISSDSCEILYISQNTCEALQNLDVCVCLCVCMCFNDDNWEQKRKRNKNGNLGYWLMKWIGTKTCRKVLKFEHF